ncbi:MAG TPA: hypothetical protein VJ725_30425 [Thermoanaerobaculia bacterium]|nr:hypothetical protein [Thermoanaerobaculia bacterium]
MAETIRQRVTVQPGGVIEIQHPDLPVGAEADVTIQKGETLVLIEVKRPLGELSSLSSFIGRGQGCFKNAAEVDDFIRAERDAWEH